MLLAAMVQNIVVYVGDMAVEVISFMAEIYLFTQRATGVKLQVRTVAATGFDFILYS